jgi:FkbM family methyltransferase
MPRTSVRLRRLLPTRPLRVLALPFRGLAQPLGIKSLPTLFNGEWIWVPSQIWQGARVRYEPYMAELLPQYLHQGDTFLDIGANFGFWSLFAGRIVGPSGRVIACEPAPEVYRVLAQSSSRYKVVTPLHMGLGSRDAVVAFAAQGTSECSSFCREVTLNSQHWKPRVSVVDVPVTMRRVDSIVEELELRPTVMKIDVEGFELEVLKGARETLENHSCPLFIEVHPYQLGLSGGSEDSLRKLLAAHGYRWRVIHRNPNTLYTLLATKESAASSGIRYGSEM